MYYFPHLRDNKSSLLELGGGGGSIQLTVNNQTLFKLL